MENLKNQEVIDISHDGRGVIKYKGQVIFVPNVLVSEIIDLKIIDQKKNYAIGELKKIIKKSPKRIDAPCIYFEKCGGCQFQNLNYNDELDQKLNRFNSLVQKFKVNYSQNIEIIASPDEFNYRNKMRYHNLTINDQNQISNFQKRSNELVKIDECMIANKKLDEVCHYAMKIINEADSNLRNRQTKTGNIEQITARINDQENEIILTIVAHRRKINNIEIIIDKIVKKYPIVKTITLQLLKPQKKDYQEIILYGPGYINYTIDKFKFQVSSSNFYQINSKQLINLYDYAIKGANLNENDYLLDAFCGTGTIGIYASNHVKRVVGVDNNSANIESANCNINNNLVTNVKFICSDIGEWAKRITVFPNKVIVDPPRQGLKPKFKQFLIDKKFDNISYISCDPMTLIRDLNDLSKYYKITDLKLFDMFPKTSHVEAVAILKRK